LSLVLTTRSTMFLLWHCCNALFKTKQDKLQHWQYLCYVMLHKCFIQTFLLISCDLQLRRNYMFIINYKKNKIMNLVNYDINNDFLNQWFFSLHFTADPKQKIGKISSKMPRALPDQNYDLSASDLYQLEDRNMSL
jgi:hypothetical protein